jgi:hypothetical protein
MSDGEHSIHRAKIGDVLGTDMAREPRAAADNVSRDMESLFRSAGFALANGRPVGSDPVVSMLGRPPAKARRSPLVALAIAGTLVACGAVWLVVTQLPTANGPTAADPSTATAARPMPPQALLAKTSVQAPAIIAPPVSTASMQEEAEAPTIRTEAPRPKPVAASSRPRPSAVKRNVARATRSSVNRACVGLNRAERYECMHDQLVDADQQLRGAYARAIRAGVDPEMLLPYRRRWARLLDQADSDPHHVTATLGRMARDLDEERTRL